VLPLLGCNTLICIAIIISRLLNLGNFGERKLNLGDSRMEILLKAQVTVVLYFIYSDKHLYKFKKYNS
jgi:hypothetical protein